MRRRSTSASVIGRFMDAYRETIDYMYSDNPQVIKDYAEFVQVPEALARRVRDDFFPKALVNPDAIKGLDALLKEGGQPEVHQRAADAEAARRFDPIPARKKCLVPPVTALPRSSRGSRGGTAPPATLAVRTGPGLVVAQEGLEHLAICGEPIGPEVIAP